MSNVIVTGGSRGLGLATAKLLAASNYNVIAAARQKGEPLEAAIKEIEARDRGRLAFTPVDLSRLEEIPDFVSRIRKEFGEIYGLVNNAGVGTAGVLANMHDLQIE